MMQADHFRVGVFFVDVIPIDLDSEQSLVLIATKVVLPVFLVPCTKLQIGKAW